ncbi:DUF2147 domain-containing protein [Histidinibacterium aquaticum]|uniref:DUF2147 domain-containing protein n=1 Tax=Histidinibacterium aquaticum TaxID=2613962 RepID=A0A5J5GCH6_9RHOB|nr:DUF2147 domain-containing protein [Histidinibacterium aquaticum]KAA9005697.1 DUF2147 domain-containing protein [Histidinibacterium aquaticum]
MKKTVLSLALCVLAGAASADPLEGLWATAPDDNNNRGIVRVESCGAALCGTLIEARDPSGARMESPNVGRQIIFDTTASGGGEYRGKVWSPDRDKTYNSRLQLTGDQLSVSGCVLGICRDGGTWVRVN